MLGAKVVVLVDGLLVISFFYVVVLPGACLGRGATPRGPLRVEERSAR